MKKLIQLLNEYNCEKLWYVDKWEIKNNKFILDYKIWTYVFRTHLYIISKEYWVIQWLVENDKIILQKDIIRRVEYSNFWVLEGIHYYSAYKSILMYLSIQDDPIEFLISILK